MSTSSSSKRQTTNSTSNIQQTDQSYRDYSQKDSNNVNDSYNTYLDGGVIAEAFDFSGDTVNQALRAVTDTTRASLDFSNDTINKSLGVAERATNSALDFASNISKNVTNPDGDLTKYALIGLLAVTVAMVVFKK